MATVPLTPGVYNPSFSWNTPLAKIMKAQLEKDKGRKIHGLTFIEQKEAEKKAKDK